MLRVDPAVREPDAEATLILSLASAWMYSDLDTLEKAISVYGDWDFARISVRNDALFVASDVCFIQSRCRRLLILCVKGTEPGNLFNWLTDASVVAAILFARARPRRLRPQRRCDVVDHRQASRRGAPRRCTSVMSSRAPRYPSRPNVASTPAAGHAPEAQGKLEALFITGHSLGAAMAALIAARLFTDSRYGEIRQRLRGVYTFGQPMIGDAGFAARAEELFGDRLFRFVYANDIVPRLPPLSTGYFVHFGKAHRSRGQGVDVRGQDRGPDAHAPRERGGRHLRLGEGAAAHHPMGAGAVLVGRSLAGQLRGGVAARARPSQPSSDSGSSRRAPRPRPSARRRAAVGVRLRAPRDASIWRCVTARPRLPREAAATGGAVMNQETLAPRTVFQGCYEILSLLRESRLAVVYEGRQIASGQPVVLKIMRLPRDDGPADLARRRSTRFLREMRRCARFTIPASSGPSTRGRPTRVSSMLSSSACPGRAWPSCCRPKARSSRRRRGT